MATAQRINGVAGSIGGMIVGNAGGHLPESPHNPWQMKPLETRSSWTNDFTHRDLYHQTAHPDVLRPGTDVTGGILQGTQALLQGLATAPGSSQSALPVGDATDR